MNRPRWIKLLSLFLAAGFLALLDGCATADTKGVWNSRIGLFTFDDAVKDYGPPDKVADLSDGTKVAEWMTQKGYSHGTFWGGPGRFMHYDEMQTPDTFLRLTFDATGKLQQWKKLAR